MSLPNPPAKTHAAVYPGSFDPHTRGHLDIIFQAAAMFSRLYVVVGVNPGKNPLFTPEERADMLRQDIEDHVRPRLIAAGQDCDIRVEKHGGLTAAFMKAHDAHYYVRGLRMGTEFDTEYPALVAGRNEYKDFTPVFLCTTNPGLQIVSSSLAREVARFGGDSLDRYVTPAVQRHLEARVAQRGLRITG